MKNISDPGFYSLSSFFKPILVDSQQSSVDRTQMEVCSSRISPPSPPVKGDTAYAERVSFLFELRDDYPFSLDYVGQLPQGSMVLSFPREGVHAVGGTEGVHTRSEYHVENPQPQLI